MSDNTSQVGERIVALLGFAIIILIISLIISIGAYVYIGMKKGFLTAMGLFFGVLIIGSFLEKESDFGKNMMSVLSLGPILYAIYLYISSPKSSNSQNQSGGRRR